MKSEAAPGTMREEVRHAVARIIDPNCWWDDVPPNDHQERKCNRALAKADEIIARLAATSPDPDSMNERPIAEDTRLASNVREGAVCELADAKGWQDISTAPKDGSQFLATGGGLASTVEIVSYNERVGAWDAMTCTLDDRDDEPQGYSQPTHWQPLPAPLSTTGEPKL